MSRKQFVLYTALSLLISLFACTRRESGSDSLNTTQTTQSFATRTSESMKLDEYSPPDDGVDYDTSPLPLYPKIDFIRRKGDKLYEGDREFRFISMNCPTALDSLPFEQEDQIKSIAQMGGQVMRTYTFTVRTKYQSQTVESYIIDKGVYNENAFKRLDNLIALCHKYGVRLIIPFIDPYTYTGGIPAFLELCGKKVTNDINTDNATFYNDKDVREAFAHFVRYVLNRKNTITGIYYKDDPAILAWESGNELRATVSGDNWMRWLCSVIRSIDKNHLIMDGSFGVRNTALENEDIDIVSDHFYPHIRNQEFDELLNTILERTRGRKPLIIGEFGFIELPKVEKFYKAVIESGVTGCLGWSLRPHSAEGGFMQHRENEIYSSYHWPGFDIHNSYEEKGFLRLTYLKAFEIQGKKPRLIEKPAVPQIITPIRNPKTWIKWQGSTGAYGYDFQRAESKDGPWITIGVNIPDDNSPYTVLFKDTSEDLVPGKTYYYRIRARSIGGFSDWSEPVAATIPE